MPDLKYILFRPQDAVVVHQSPATFTLYVAFLCTLFVVPAFSVAGPAAGGVLTALALLCVFRAHQGGVYVTRQGVIIRRVFDTTFFPLATVRADLVKNETSAGWATEMVGKESRDFAFVTVTNPLNGLQVNCPVPAFGDEPHKAYERLEASISSQRRAPVQA